MKIRKPIHDDWETPPEFMNKLIKEFGLMFDPCPIDYKINGLYRDWKKVNFVNPPYNRKVKEQFIYKAYEESLRGNTSVMLLPVSTSTKIFHNIIYPNAEIRFIKGRIKFIGINSKGEKVNNKCGQHDSMLVIFRGKNGINR